MEFVNRVVCDFFKFFKCFLGNFRQNRESNRPPRAACRTFPCDRCTCCCACCCPLCSARLDNLFKPFKVGFLSFFYLINNLLKLLKVFLVDSERYRNTFCIIIVAHFAPPPKILFLLYIEIMQTSYKSSTSSIVSTRSSDRVVILFANRV